MVSMEQPQYDDSEHLRRALAAAAKLLPEQSPLENFVHHNTLHAFEAMPFPQAVEHAASVFGTEPYPTLDAFAGDLDSGRITPEDIDQELKTSDPQLNRALWPLGPTRRALWRALMLEASSSPGPDTMAWLLAENRLPGARRSQAARWPQDRRAALWTTVAEQAPKLTHRVKGTRLRDVVKQQTQVDIDLLVQPTLIQLTGGFLDQGISYWRMPLAGRGLLEVFRDLYSRRLGPPDSWIAGLNRRLRSEEQRGLSAEDTVLQCLTELGIAHDRWEATLTDTLLALRGWAGMMHKLEHQPELATVEAPQSRLIDYLAVQMELEAQAARWVVNGRPEQTSLAELMRAPTPYLQTRDDSNIYSSFLVAQHLGLVNLPQEPNKAAILVSEVSNFPAIRRREFLHRAYERHHRRGVLDMLVASSANPVHVPSEKPEFQAVFCIDDREESLRRHLEEINPRIETLGYAGFFGIPMAYQGQRDVRPRALCPVSIKPRHLVEEVRATAESGDRGGGASHAQYVGSRTLFRGTLLAGFGGILTMVPLMLRVLFPRATNRLMHQAGGGHTAQEGRLVVTATGEVRSTHLGDLIVGFSIREQADIVRRVLTDMGVIDRLSELFMVVGHGSSSLNNPHEAAHDCGATGGGRGGPNGRTFAAMANNPEVRSELAKLGLAIPAETFFVGGYHNTCDDSVTYYDLHLIPTALKAKFEVFRAAMNEARRRDAHERVRRFETESLDGTPEEMLAIAEAHAVDLAQPRPEYGHATNAICHVGPRRSTQGVFLDRRAFLVSYDSACDPDHDILAGLLASVAPVGAGINLEYYFSFVDPVGYGSGTKLPHNVTGLIGVMNGHQSDLRTGLPWQMVEIHEPVRLLTIIEAEPETLVAILDDNPSLKRLVVNAWIQVVAWSPSSRRIYVFENGGFVEHIAPTIEAQPASSSGAIFRGKRGHIEPALIRSRERCHA